MKKINYIFIISILLITIIILLGYLVFYKELDIQEDISKQNLEISVINKIEFKQCRERLIAFSDERIIEELNTRVINPPVLVFAKLIDYFRCEINKNYQVGKLENFSEIIKKINFDNVKILDANIFSERDIINSRIKAEELDYDSSLIEDPELFLEKYQKEDIDALKIQVERNFRFPVYELIKNDLEKICPDNNENDEIIKELAFLFARNSDDPEDEIALLVGDYCTQLREYSDNTDKLNDEIYNFSNWADDIGLKVFEINWKTLLAYRFGGKEKAENICLNDLNQEDKNTCEKIIGLYSRNFEKNEDYSDNCKSERDYMIDKICKELLNS